MTTNLCEGCPCEQEREDVGRVEADEAAGVGSGLRLGLWPGEGEADAQQTRGRQQKKLRIEKRRLYNEELPSYTSGIQGIGSLNQCPN